MNNLFWKRYDAEVKDTDALFYLLIHPLDIKPEELPSIWKVCREIVLHMYNTPL